MSIRFQTTKDEWDYDKVPEERTIREVKLYEVGPVAFPANEATSVALRSLMSHLDDAGRAILLDQIGTRRGAGTTTPPKDEPPVGPEPTPLVTRQEKRRMALLLSGVTDEALGAAS
jgi:hypothetical protein